MIIRFFQFTTKAIVGALFVLSIFACSSKRVINDEDKILFTNQLDTIVGISHINGLVLYDVPETNIELLTYGDRKLDYSSAFACTGAFTSSNGSICGHYLDNTGYVKNMKDKNITGGFIWNGYQSGVATGTQWSFYMGGYEAELQQRVNDGSALMAFAQNMIIYHFVKQDLTWRMHNGEYDIFKYRALCEINGNLFVIESEGLIPYDSFVDKLISLEVRHALYLDMGTYNYLWCLHLRNENSSEDDVVYIDDKSPNVEKVSNWICFDYFN